MKELVIDEKGIQDNEILKEGAKTFYQKLYEEEFSRSPKLNGIQFQELDETNRIDIEREFSKDEILEGLKECNSNKAPGPDGFNMEFLQDFWLVVKEDVVDFFKEFHKAETYVKISEFHLYCSHYKG